MPSTNPHRIGLAAAALLLSLAVAGCAPDSAGAPVPTGTDAAQTQSVEDACALVRDTVADAVAALQEIDPTDPAGAVEALTAVSERLARAASDVDNTQVAALLPDVEAGFSSSVDALEAVAGGDPSRLPELQSSVADLQSALMAFADLCPAV